MAIIEAAGDTNRVMLSALYDALPDVEWDAVLCVLNDKNYFESVTVGGEAAVLIHPKARYDYQQFLLVSNERTRKEKRTSRDELRGWITTIIAVLAFLLSALSIAWQITKWMQEKEELKESQSIAATTTAAGGVSSNLPSWSVCVSFAPTSFVNIAG